MSSPNVQIVIPARLASTRLPRKLLLAETGKPLIQHTFEAAGCSQLAGGVIVAADCEEMASAVRGFGGVVRLTDPQATSGTDRIAEIARTMPEVEVFVNVQGDEPEISGAAIDAVVALLHDRPTASLATLATPIRDERTLRDPNCVKVVTDHQSRAVYFSRSVIPYPREAAQDECAMANALAADPPAFLLHIGLYAYRREFLLKLPDLPPSPLEQLERLEQLRALQAGHEIAVAIVNHHAPGIDTREDYDAFKRRWQSEAAANN